MFDLNQLKDMVSRYTGASTGQPPENVHADFDEAARNAPPETMAEGVAHAFRSDETAPFQQMVSQLHANGNPQQQTGIVQKLMSSLGGGGGLPAALAAIPGLSALRGMTGSNASNITPEQASQLSPQAVEQLAQHAQSQNPAVVDQLGGFVSQHPGLVKTLGAGALTVVMTKILSHHHA